MTYPYKIVSNEVRKGSTPFDIEKYLPVTNGTHFNGNGGATQTSLIQTRCRQTRKLLRVISGGATKLQVEWANIWTTNTPQAGDASCEINNANSVTLRMAIEYPAGNPRLVSSSTNYSAGTAYAIDDQVVSSGIKYVCIQAGTGQTPASSPAYWRVVNTYIVRWDTDTDANGTITFAPGDYRKSETVALSERLLTGDKLAILGAFDSGSSSNYIPYAGSSGASNAAPFVDWVVDVGTGLPAVGSSLVETGITNQTNGNTTTSNNTTQSAWMHIPYATAITGNSPDPTCVALVGDSLMLGTGGDIRDGQPAGIYERALDGYAYWKICQGGNRAQCYTKSNAPWQLSCVARCSAAYTDMGQGDIQANVNDTNTKAYMVRLWQALASTGVPVYTGLFLPMANSTDSWATLTNQSRWTNGGAANTTQFPNDDATYLTSIYGIVQMWLGQDGAPFALDSVNTSVKVGQLGHPLEGILDAHALVADPATSWKWNPGYTADGAHPNASAVQVQAIYLAKQMEPVVLGRRQIEQAPPQYNPIGLPPVESMPRHQVNGNSPSEAAAGTFLVTIGVSPGRYYYGFRIAAGSATAASRSWTLLSGMDPAKLKVLQSGTFTPTASAIQDTALSGSPVYIPAGQVMCMALTVPITTANVYLGQNASFANLNKQGLNFVTAGKSTNTAALTGTISAIAQTSGSNTFAAHAFRLWVEIY